MSLLTVKSLADQDIQEGPVDYYHAKGANDFTRHPSILLHGLKSLHVTFDKIA